MDPLDEPSRILHDLRIGDFALTRHAKQRMDLRGITRRDIHSCAETLVSIQEQAGGRYRLEGFDLSGALIQVIAAWDGETVIITLMGD